jgi:ribose transport system substrate-binding protein
MTRRNGWGSGLNRRDVVKMGAGLVGFAAMASSLPRIVFAQGGGWTLANSLRSLSNPYHAAFAEGGKRFAESVGAPYEVLVTEGNSEKGIADIRALLARTGGKLCLNVDPNDSPDARVIVEDCKKAGA